MSTIFDNDILIHYIASPGLPGDGFTAPEALVIRNDLDTLLARPVITELDDVPDVDTAGATGTALIKQADGTWAARVIPTGIDFYRGAGFATEIPDITRVDLGPGLWIQHISSGRAMLEALFGGTGSSNSVARQDHTHNLHADQHFPFSASGTLSGGTRTLVTGTVTGLDPERTYFLKGKVYVHMRGDGSGASFTRPSVTIGGSSRNIFEDSRVVAGVLITEVAMHEGLGVTGVTTVAVSAAVSFQPGDPAYIGGGVLAIEIQANR